LGAADVCGASVADDAACCVGAPVQPSLSPAVCISACDDPSTTLFPYTTLFRSEGSDANTNTATARTDIVRHADLGITKSDSPDPERKSTHLNSSHVDTAYADRITDTNHGPSDSSGFVVTDTLPTGFTYADATSD